MAWLFSSPVNKLVDHLKEHGDEGHLVRVRVLPGRDRLHLLPGPLFHQADEGVLVAGAAVLVEHTVLHAASKKGFPMQIFEPEKQSNSDEC